MKSKEGTVELHALLVRAVVQKDVETSAGGYNYLMTTLVCVSAAVLAAWNVVGIEDALYFEGHMLERIYIGEVAFFVVELCELVELAVIHS